MGDRALGVAGAAIERPQRGARRIGACGNSREGETSPLSYREEREARRLETVGGFVGFGD